MVHRIVVEDQSLRWYGRPPKIADDSIEFVKLQFHLPEEWASLLLVAQFTQADTYNVLLSEDICFLPRELTAGLCRLSLFGYAEGKPLRATSIPLVFQIEKSGFVSSAETPIPPTPDLYAQLLKHFSVAPEEISKAVEDYLLENPPEAGADGKDGISPHVGDNGNWFVGATDTGIPATGPAGGQGLPGPQGDPGNPGADGFSPSAKVEQTSDGSRITITDKSGTTTAVVRNGTNGSGEGGGPVDAVRYGEQALNDAEQAQARTNIGAVSMEEVEELLGIEKEFSVSGELIEFDVDVEPGTEIQVISKIHRDETWGLSDKLVLHQVSGTNFVDLSSWLGGVGTVFEKNGLTVTVNADSTVTIRGTNESSDWSYPIDITNWTGDLTEKVYPAGTYSRPEDLMIYIRAAQYPNNKSIAGFTSNLGKTVTIPEPFRIVMVKYSVKAGATVDVTVPLGLFRGDSVPETGCEYNGQLHTVTFDTPVYDGEFNWATGELKDADGNTVGYYDTPDIKRLPGTNYFWTGFGENAVSNLKDEGKVILRMNETAPEDTIPSICDFMFIPTTPEAAYALYYTPFLPSGQFYGNEVPVMTTKGILSVKDADGNVKYSKYIEPMFNTRGVSDILTHKGLEKKWSGKFYLNKLPASITPMPAPNSWNIDNDLFVWEFDESEFANTGIPAKIHDIPMASACFKNNDSSEDSVQNQSLYNGAPYPAFFSYNEATGKYTLTARGIQGGLIKHQLTHYSKVHFYYQLETPYNLPFTFAMGIDAGDTISFEADLTDNQPYIDALADFKNRSVEPTVTAFIPRNVEDAMGGMNNAARILNTAGTTGGDATVQGYSWIGAGDGVTDYTVQIQSKLDELHNISNGGTIHLGPGTYPISKSLIVYGNTTIIGDGNTIIEQRADNTHAVVWSGSKIRMCDLTIKLAGVCTEITACIYANDNNPNNGIRDERYPENTYVNFCSTSNVTLIGTYSISQEEGYDCLSDEALSYRGVGITSTINTNTYFTYYDSDALICRHLYAGVYGGGGSCNYRMYVTESRFAVYCVGGGNNIYDIHGHTYYSNGGRNGKIYATDYIFYGKKCVVSKIMIGFYDIQYATGSIYFDIFSHSNQYSIVSSDSGIESYNENSYWDNGYVIATDYGRGNNEIQPVKEYFAGVGSALFNLSGLPIWNTQFNPSIHNALSGAGVWGSITSNNSWSDSDGIGLQDVCRYPKEATLKTYFGLASTICESSPSEESPVEITIDISNRPLTNYDGFWIQFDHRYIAEDFTISIDTTNDGEFDRVISMVRGNFNAIYYRFNYQEPARMAYRIKISITKALQIPDFTYPDSSGKVHINDYNPDGLVGIVNIGMPSNEAYGRAFLGECGGSLYGNVDMHQNTLKNLSDPVDAGDAVSKSYLEAKIAELKALINGM